jgi:hypothetical protein
MDLGPGRDGEKTVTSHYKYLSFRDFVVVLLLLRSIVRARCGGALL